ncbi:hypothetical protein CHUAL_009629 [Chamberlinius hualienensis]
MMETSPPETPATGQVEEQELNVPDDINEVDAPPEDKQEGAKQRTKTTMSNTTYVTRSGRSVKANIL